MTGNELNPGDHLGGSEAQNHKLELRKVSCNKVLSTVEPRFNESLRLESAFDDLNNRLSLFFAKLVMMSTAPAKSAGDDARYASQDLFIRSNQR